MTQPIYDEQILSDLHKDARGFRPREYFWSSWNSMTVEERNDEWRHLLLELEQANADEADRQARAIDRYEASIAELINSGAADRSQAISWLLDSVDDHGFNGDAGYACFLLGLPYSMEAEFEPYMVIQREKRRDGP